MSNISITIKPTNACNMRCKHCYHADEGFSKEILEINAIERILELAANEYEQINVLIHGGEPTLCGKEYLSKIFDIEKSISMKKHCTFNNTIQTNGVLLDVELIELFKENRVNLGISFDGPHNNELRTHTDYVFNKLKLLKELKMKFSVLCVETNNSISNIIDTYKWFKNEKLSYKILPIFSSGNAKNIEDSMMSADKYACHMKELYLYWIKDIECNIKVSTLEDFLTLFAESGCLKYGDSCIYHRLALNADGNIYPCGRPYSEEFCLGSIEDIESISACFIKHGYQRLVHISKERKLNCEKQCKYYLICKGGCISNSILDESFTEIGGKSCLNAFKLFEMIEPINNMILDDIKAGKEQLYNPRVVKIIKQVYKL